MNRTASINLKGINVAFFRDNVITIVLLVLTVISMLCGNLSLRNEAVATFAESRFADFIAARGEARFINAFLTALIESVKLPIISFLCGTSVLGTIISPLVLFYCAFSSVIPTVISCASRQASSSLTLRGCTTISPGVRIILRREETGLPSA